MDYQGLTIQFNGDASGLLATLRQIDGVTTETQRSLSQVTKALKLDPSSAALYAAQSKLIRTDYKDRQDELFRLKSSYDDYTRKLKNANFEQTRAASRLPSVKKAYSEASAALNESTASYDASIAQLRRLAPERTRLMREDVQLVNQQKELEAERVQLEAQKESVYGRTTNKSQRRAADKALKENSRLLEENSRNIATNKARLAEADREYNRIVGGINDSTTAMRRARGEQRRYGEEIKDLTTRQKDAAEQSKAYSKEADELKRKMAVARAEIKRLREEMARLDVSEWLNTTKSGQFFAGLGSGGALLSNVGDKLMMVGARATATEVALLGMFGRQVLSNVEEYGNAISRVGGYLDLTETQLNEMSDLALYWGKETQFSATEAADAMSELAKGGMTDAQIKGGALEATMQLAAAGGIDMATAATVAVNAIKVFDLNAEDATDVADALAGAANKSTAEIGSLASAFRYVSGWAGLADYSINDVSGALGLLADHGLQAEMAGTGLRNFMQRLGAPTGKAKELLEQYGVEVYDTSGKMKGLADLVDELNEAFGDLDDETRNETLNTIFGARALPAAIALMGAGRDELEEYIAATERQGYALEMMQARMGDLGWALEYLRGEFETAQVNLGQALTPMLIGAANAVEDLLSAFNSMPREQQFEWAKRLLELATVGPKLLAIGAAMKVIGGAMVGISKVVIAFRALTATGGTIGLAMETLTGGAIAAGGAMAALAGGIAAVVAVIGAVSFGKYMWGQYKAQQRTEKLQQATQGLVDTVDDIKTGDAVTGIDEYGRAARSAAEDVETLIDQQSQLAETISDRNSDAQAQIDELERARRIIQDYGDETGLTAQQLADLHWALELVNGEFGTNYQYNADLGGIYDEQGDAIGDLIGKIDELILAREREIQAAAIQDNMRDLYQEQSRLAASRKQQEYEYLQQLEEVRRREADLKRLEENRAKIERENPDHYEESPEWQQANADYGNALTEYESAKARADEMNRELEETDDLIEANSKALQEYRDQLAEVLAEAQTDAERLEGAFKILGNTSGETGTSIRTLFDELVNIPDDGVDSMEDLSNALADAGVNMDALVNLTDDELLSMLEQSSSVEEFIGLFQEWANTHATATADVEGTEEATQELEETKQSAEAVDNTDATITVTTDTSDAQADVDGFRESVEFEPPAPVPIDADAAQAIEQADLAQDSVDNIVPPPPTPIQAEASSFFTTMSSVNASLSNLPKHRTIYIDMVKRGAQMRDGGIVAHADGYITNHRIYSGNHLIGEAGIEAVLPLNNRAATQPLTDTIASGVASRLSGGTQYNLYINDARVNDDPAIRSAFIDLMGALNRKGMMTNAAR